MALENYANASTAYVERYKACTVKRVRKNKRAHVAISNSDDEDGDTAGTT